MTEYWVMAGAKDPNPISRHRIAWRAILAAREWEKKHPGHRVQIFRSKPIGRGRWNPKEESMVYDYLRKHSNFVSWELGYTPKRMT